MLRNMMSASSCLRTLVLGMCGSVRLSWVRVTRRIRGDSGRAARGQVHVSCGRGAGVVPHVVLPCGGRPPSHRRPVNGGVESGHEDDGDSKRPGWFRNRTSSWIRSSKVCKQYVNVKICPNKGGR